MAASTSSLWDSDSIFTLDTTADTIDTAPSATSTQHYKHHCGSGLENVSMSHRLPPRLQSSAARYAPEHRGALCPTDHRVSSARIQPSASYTPRGAVDGLSHHLFGLHATDVLTTTDEIEAAWEDGSCIDGGSPSLPACGRLAEPARHPEDRLEIDALRRQVEQLQMALQLQSRQREHERLPPSCALPPPPACPAMDSRTASSSGSSSAVSTQQSRRYPLAQPRVAGYYDPAQVYIASQLSHPYGISSPAPSTAKSLASDETDISDLARKVDALQQIVQNLALAPTPAAASDPAFRYNPTPPPNTSGASVDSIPKASSRLAAALRLRPSSSTSQLALPTQPQAQQTARVSWSRKRTEKVSVPQAKLRQGPGRGRMVIKDTSSK